MTHLGAADSAPDGAMQTANGMSGLPESVVATEAERAEERRRAEALERLAGGDLDDYQPEELDDRLPRNRSATLVHFVPPEYPKELAGTGASAEVQVSLMVDRQGRASHVRVEDSADPLFTSAALDAINQWQFSPRIREGRLSHERVRFTVLVSEEVGDRPVHDYPGGRIAIERVVYEERPDVPLRRYFGLRPAFPFDLLVARRAGEVVLEWVVGDDGMPREIKILEATHRDFAYACQGALVHWRYAPAEKNARAVNTRIRCRMSFEPEELDEELVALAQALDNKGMPEGLETARSINQQPRVARQLSPSNYDGTRGAPRRRRVTVEAVITEHGEVRVPRVLSAPDPLSGYIALAAVNYWRFDPARKNGVAVPVLVSLPVTF